MKHIIEFIFKIYYEVLNIYKELLSTLNVGNLYLDLTKSKINFIVRKTIRTINQTVQSGDAV